MPRTAGGKKLGFLAFLLRVEGTEPPRWLSSQSTPVSKRAAPARGDQSAPSDEIDVCKGSSPDRLATGFHPTLTVPGKWNHETPASRRGGFTLR